MTSSVPDWERQLRSLLPLFGHRNWIVVADSAYPAQSKPGIETIAAGEDQMRVVRKVLGAITACNHIRANVYVDKELAFVAARCLENVGKSAERALCQCLTNGDWQVRHLSVSALASVTDDVEVYISRIKPRLSDVEPGVRFATVQAIAEQNEAPELAVPLLISALRDADDGVCAQATGGLAGFGTNASSAFP